MGAGASSGRSGGSTQRHGGDAVSAARAKAKPDGHGGKHSRKRHHRRHRKRHKHHAPAKPPSAVQTLAAGTPGAAGLPGAAAPPAISSQPATAVGHAAVPSLGAAITLAQARRLLWRAGFGPTPGQAEALAGQPIEAVVQALTRPTRRRRRCTGRRRPTTKATRSRRRTRGARITAGGSTAWSAPISSSSSG